MKQAVIYVSTPTEKEELSSQEMVEECRKYAEERDWSVVRTVTDDDADESAIERPGFRDVLNMIGASKFDVLIVYRSDLLADRVVLQLIIESVLEQVGVEVDYAQKDIDNSPEARLSRPVFAAFDDYEQTKSDLRDQLGAD